VLHRTYAALRVALALLGLMLLVVTVTPLGNWYARTLAGPWNDPDGDILILLGSDDPNDGFIGGATLWCARIIRALMPRPFPTSIRDAAHRAQPCGALDGLREAGVDAPFGAARGKAGLGHRAPDSCERSRFVIVPGHL
jgi:hypothetical protein